MPKSQSSTAGRARRPRRKSEPVKPPNGHANGHANGHTRGSPRRLPILGADAAPAGGRQPVSCLNCGLCCSYVAVEIDEPTTIKAATDILWYLYHQNICIYAEGDEWMVQIEARCQHYQDDHKCAIYETRPKICRDYDETNCEINAEEVGNVFYTPGEFLAYLAQHYKRIHTLVKKRYMPPADTLDGRPIGRKRVGPFKPRYEGLRALASRPPD
jgi:Fe-S-cluster containining protein